MPPHWGLWASSMWRGTVGDGTETGPTFWDGGANADVHLFHLIVQEVDKENRLGLLGKVPSLFRTPSHPSAQGIQRSTWCFKLSANKL